MSVICVFVCVYIYNVCVYNVCVCVCLGSVPPGVCGGAGGPRVRDHAPHRRLHPLRRHRRRPGPQDTPPPRQPITMGEDTKHPSFNSSHSIGLDLIGCDRIGCGLIGCGLIGCDLIGCYMIGFG